MSRALTIQSLISLVGEDKLREELAKNSYTYLEIQDFRGDRLYIDDGVSFYTDNNPVEWLVFNSPKAFWMFYSATGDHVDLTDLILNTADKYKITIDERVEFDAEDKESVANAYLLTLIQPPGSLGDLVPTEWAEVYWNNISRLKIQTFSRLLQEVRPAVDIIDKNNKSIFRKYLFGKSNAKVKDL